MTIELDQFLEGPFQVFIRAWPPSNYTYETLEDAMTLGVGILQKTGIAAAGHVEHLTEQIDFEFLADAGSPGDSLTMLTAAVEALEAQGFTYSHCEHERLSARVASQMRV